MTSTTNDQFCDPPPHPLYPEKWTINLLFKDNRKRKRDKFQDHPPSPPTPFHGDVINL